MAIVFGGSPNIFMFWLLVFPENGSISEPTVNRALIVHTVEPRYKEVRYNKTLL